VFAVDVLQLAVTARDISMESLRVIGRMYCFVLHISSASYHCMPRCTIFTAWCYYIMQ